jgi:4'-phosphopantetheinyl transferase
MKPSSIDVYIVNLNQYALPDLNACQTLLPQNEFLTTQNFATNTLKQKALAARILTRQILAKYTQLNPKDIAILRKEFEKPKLAPPFAHLNFSIAHTKTYFALAITRDALIGVDVESLDKKTDILGIAKRFFCPEEYQALSTAADPQDLFFRIWTQKEAFVKAIGAGLSFGLEKFCVDPEQAKILRIDDSHYQAAAFHSHLIKLPEQHYLCITTTQNLADLNIINL